MDPFLIAQGWNESALESALNAAFAAGLVSPGIYEVPVFVLPDITINVQPNTMFEITTEDVTTVETPDDPSNIPALSRKAVLMLVVLMGVTGVLFLSRNRMPLV